MHITSNYSNNFVVVCYNNAMIPISDSHKSNRLPVFTISLITINVIVFLIEILNPNPEAFISAYSFIPANFIFSNLNTWGPIFNAAFMHAGVSHILFNMLFLWVFGDNVEEELGPIKFLIFYFGAIIAATLLQYIVDVNSQIPNLGASGAIAGILGYYLVRFPRHRISTVMFFGGRIYTRLIPAQVFLGYWAVTQLFSGFGSIATANDGGVAWFAHIGGLVFGVIIGLITNTIRPQTDKYYA